VPLSSLSGFNRCLLKIAEVKAEAFPGLKEQLTDQPAAISVISAEKNLTYVLIIYHQSLKEEVEAIFPAISLTLFRLSLTYPG